MGKISLNFVCLAKDFEQDITALERDLGEILHNCLSYQLTVGIFGVPTVGVVCEVFLLLSQVHVYNSKGSTKVYTDVNFGFFCLEKETLLC